MSNKGIFETVILSREDALRLRTIIQILDGRQVGKCAFCKGLLHEQDCDVVAAIESLEDAIRPAV